MTGATPASTSLPPVAPEGVHPAPAVSVVIPTRDRRAQVLRAISGALGQDHRDLEVIVVDDGSTDGTADEVASIDDLRLRYRRLDPPRGAAEARNEGIRGARGRWVAFLDSDDEWMPQRLGAQLEHLDGSTRSAGYCGWRTIDDSTGRITSPDPGSMVDGDIHPALLTGWMPHGCSVLIVKRSLLLEAGMFDPDLSAFQDLDLVLRLAALTHFDAVREPLVLRHSHWEERMMSDPGRIDAWTVFMAKWRSELVSMAGERDTRALDRYHRRATSRANVLTLVRSGHRRRALGAFRQYLATLRPPYLRARPRLREVAGLVVALTLGWNGYLHARSIGPSLGGGER